MEVPKSWSVFKNIKREPKRFTYQPKHYDAKEEEFEKRMKRIEDRVRMKKGEQVSAPEQASFDFKKSHRRSKSNYRSGLAAANKRLIIILVILVAMFAVAVKWLENLGG